MGDGNGVSVHCANFDVLLAVGPDIVDVTDHVAAIVRQSGVRDGGAQLTAIGSTASLSAIEFEPGAVADLKRAIGRLAPADLAYQHELAWHDGNGHSHVQAALLGPSLAVPIRDGRLRLGTWQQIILINHDTRPRRRTVEVTVVGHGQKMERR
ncbi:MAG: secondary thiamine-phosphate synthase enzyme YjbQ [Rhodospirillales bacterium]